MPAKKLPTGTDADLNLSSMTAILADEDRSREFLEAKRWPDGKPVCPHCGGEGYALTPKPTSKRPGRKGLKKCKTCRKQFTVRVGTIFEESKIQIRQWLMAIHLMTSSKKGVSSHQIARELGITQKSAWFVCHRIREAMKQEPLKGMLLKGTVEADETYIGGRNRPKGQGGQGRSTKTKMPVFALVERGGRVRAVPITKVNAKNLRRHIKKRVDTKNARLMTDDFPTYRGFSKDFPLGHGIIRHKDRVYAIGDVTTNTAESFFALLKRGVHGIFHHVSRRHLRRYCNEFSFRWDHRKLSDGARMVAAIQSAEGKRLKYKEPA
jgi:transposase-like protein